MMTATRVQPSSMVSEEEASQALIERAEIEEAIDSVINAHDPRATRRAWHDMSQCWRCGSQHLAALKNRSLDRPVGWCMDCGRTWIGRRLR
jgi:hypothetical protein